MKKCIWAESSTDENGVRGMPENCKASGCDGNDTSCSLFYSNKTDKDLLLDCQVREKEMSELIQELMNTVYEIRANYSNVGYVPPKTWERLKTIEDKVENFWQREDMK